LAVKEYVFCDCWSLSSVQLPSGVTNIGYLAFKGCRSLPSIALPESLTSIGCDAFNGCASLTAIKIPSSLSRVGRTAFSLCSQTHIHRAARILHLHHPYYPDPLWIGTGTGQLLPRQTTAYTRQSYDKQRTGHHHLPRLESTGQDQKPPQPPLPPPHGRCT